MRVFAADPQDKAAIATLTADPGFVGRIGTTCVATIVNGGHALNALPQRATANINCRIFPGHKPAAIMAELQQVVADPGVQFKDVSEGSVANDASPIRADFVAAVAKAMARSIPACRSSRARHRGRATACGSVITTCRATARARCSSRAWMISAMG
jgi:carboxypeptidase PM20D1